MRTHPHVATPYEIKAAAEQRLKVIVLPVDQDVLQPRILLKYDPKDGISQETTINPMFWDKIPYREGDRVYLQEEWWDDRVTDDPSEVVQYYLKSADPHLTHNWELAETMPMEAAQHWFAIAGVRVVQMRKLTFQDAVDAGCKCFPVAGSKGYKSELVGLAELQSFWNAAYSEQPWDRDLWVIVLQVETITP